MEAKSFGPSKVTVWSCENCIYLHYDIDEAEDFCNKLVKTMPGSIPTWTLCPYLKNESTNS